MGRLIDADKFEAFVIRTNGDAAFVNGVQYVLEKIDNAPTVESIPKDQYEAQLKAEKVAMLDKIREEIKEMTSNRGFLSCSVDYIHEEIDNVFDKYKAE